MGKGKKKVTMKIHNRSVSSVINAIQRSFVGGSSDDCLEFALKNPSKVHNAYRTAATCHGCDGRRIDTERGYQDVLGALDRAIERHSRNYVTGFSRSGRP